MMPRKHFPHADRTETLRMRINKDSQWFDLRPMDLDLERFLNEHQGHATVKLEFLILRNRDSPGELRYYHPVTDA